MSSYHWNCGFFYDADPLKQICEDQQAPPLCNLATTLEYSLVVSYSWNLTYSLSICCLPVRSFSVFLHLGFTCFSLKLQSDLLAHQCSNSLRWNISRHCHQVSRNFPPCVLHKLASWFCESQDPQSHSYFTLFDAKVCLSGLPLWSWGDHLYTTVDYGLATCLINLSHISIICILTRLSDSCILKQHEIYREERLKVGLIHFNHESFQEEVVCGR